MISVLGAGSTAPVAPQSATLDDMMRAHILDALHATHWVVAGPHGAAARLGLKRSTLASRMAKLGIVRQCLLVLSSLPEAWALLLYSVSMG